MHGYTWSHTPTILFTNGLNIMDRRYGDDHDTSAQVDSRMTALCSAIRSTGVTIFTVQIGADGSDVSACATDA